MHSPPRTIDAPRGMGAAPVNPQRPARAAVLVVALTSLGPLSTDFYLPALPAIARALDTDSVGVQLTLSVYLLGFGAGQLLVGPLSDRFGGA